MRLIFFLVFLSALTPAQACGVKTDCQLGDRLYRIYIPNKAEKTDRPGAIIFAHGYKGSAAGTMSDRSLLKLADELGVALVAAEAVDGRWQLPGRPRSNGVTGEAEFAYFRRLVDELAKRYAIDRKKLLVTGFSAGGMMVWNLACHMGQSFAGYAPIAGTFWAPVPEHCRSRGEVDLIHYHGTTDEIVPITGRPIADSKQGDVMKALRLFTREGHFGPEKPMPVKGLTCMRRKNPEGRILEFCKHGRGHLYKADYVRRAWRELHIAG